MNPEEYLIYYFLKKSKKPLITQHIIEGIKPNHILEIEKVLEGMARQGHLKRRDFSGGRNLWMILKD